MKDLKQKHFLIAGLSIIIGAVAVLPMEIPNIIFTLSETALVTMFMGKYEKEDELVEANINKANKITMILLLVALVVFHLLTLNGVTIPANVFGSVACCAVAARSILFLWLDRTLSDTKENN